MASVDPGNLGPQTALVGPMLTLGLSTSDAMPPKSSSHFHLNFFLLFFLKWAASALKPQSLPCISLPPL